LKADESNIERTERKTANRWSTRSLILVRWSQKQS